MRQCIMCGRTFPVGTELCEFDGTTLFDVSGDEAIAAAQDPEEAAKMGEFSASLSTASSAEIVANDTSNAPPLLDTGAADVAGSQHNPALDASGSNAQHPSDVEQHDQASPTLHNSDQHPPALSDTDRLVAGIEQEMEQLDETGSDSFAPLPLPITSDNLVTPSPTSIPMEHVNVTSKSHHQTPVAANQSADESHGSSTTPITLLIIGLCAVATIVSLIYIAIISNPDMSQHPPQQTQQTAPTGEATKTLDGK